MYSDEERRAGEESTEHVTNQQTVHPHEHVRSVKNGKKTLYLLEEVPPILGKVPEEKTCETNRSRNLPPTALPRIHREYQNVDHPTDRPTDRPVSQSLLFSFHASIIHHSSFIIIPPNNNE